MSHYLVLSFVDVQSANAIAGFTWGFPAVTSFLGFSHVLERKFNEHSHSGYKIEILGCSIVSNKIQQRVYEKNWSYHFIQSRTAPLYGTGIVEEGKLNMTVSLVLDIQGSLPKTNDEIAAFEQEMLNVCYALRIAGGTILNIKQLKLISAHPSNDTSKVQRAIKSMVMPGFILKDRRGYLAEHHEQLVKNNPEASIFDAWLDFSALKYKAERVSDGDEKISDKAQWNYVPKPQKGYLVPLMVGYKSISDLYEPGDVANVRDTTVPARFVEAVHSVGEWQGAHRIKDIQTYMWKYHYLDEHWYLCQQNNPEVNSLETEENLTEAEELTLNQALDLLF